MVGVDAEQVGLIQPGADLAEDLIVSTLETPCIQPRSECGRAESIQCQFGGTCRGRMSTMYAIPLVSEIRHSAESYRIRVSQICPVLVWLNGVIETFDNKIWAGCTINLDFGVTAKHPSIDSTISRVCSY